MGVRNRAEQHSDEPAIFWRRRKTGHWSHQNESRRGLGGAESIRTMSIRTMLTTTVLILRLVPE